LDIPTSFYEFLKFETISEFKIIEKHLNPRAQYWAENRPEATAHGAWRPAIRGRLKQPRGVAGDLEGATGEVPGKEEGAEAHRSDVSTVRRRKRRRVMAFNGGGVALVVIDDRGEVLQLEGD
jgi:hypothetical protein